MANEYFDAKITVRSQVHYLGKIKGKLEKNRSRISLFRESVFGPWLDLDIPPCRADDNHLLNFVLQNQVYIPKLLDHCPPISFRIGDNVLQFGRWEFLLITGLVFGPLPDLAEVDNTPLGLRLFPDKKFDKKFIVKGSELLALFENDKQFDALSNEDAVRVCLLIVADVIFNGRGSWYVVPNHFFQLVENFSAWNAYPWGEFLWRRLYVHLANVVPKRREAYSKKNQKSSPSNPVTYTLCGFIWAFKIWIIESYPNSSSWWNKDPSKIPRGLSWSKGKTFRKHDYNLLRGSGSNPILKLVPTSEERLQPWFVRSNDYFVEHNLIQSQAGLLTTSVKKNDQIASPVSCHVVEKVLKNCTARLSKLHPPDMSIRRCQNSQSETKLGMCILSSNDPNMPSKAVKKPNGKRKRDDKKVKSILLSDSENEVEHEKIKPSSIDPPMSSKSDFMCKYNQMPVKLDLDELFAGILTTRAKKDDQVKRVLVSLDSESEEEHENIKPSSIDPPMPAKSVKERNGKRKRNKKQAQPVEHGENLVGKRIKVWWAADNSYRQGVVKSFDHAYNSYKMHKVSFDDGDEEMLELKRERWELVENVSPISDSVGVAVPGRVSSSQSDMICVQGYKVKNINAPILESIFRSHGDIAAKCVFTDAAVRTSLLEAVCEIARWIKTNDVTNIISKMDEIESKVSAAEASKINVSWLQPHLETIRKRNEAQIKKTLLMEMKANTTLVKMAAKTDLKESCDEFAAAIDRLVKAKKCVQVLELVEKKLSNDVLEFKAEKDLFVGQPILYAD